MAEDQTNETVVVVRPRGPYLVPGEVTVRRSTIVTTEHGESATYLPQTPLDTGDGLTALCRCGHSANKPMCDGSHNSNNWEDTETASGTYDERASVLGGTGFTVRDDRSLCVHAGFCGTKATNLWKLVDQTEDSGARMQAIGMIEACPSGALTYTLDGQDEPNEQVLQINVQVLDDGPLYLQGGIAVESATGDRYETRNRTALCRCGASANKPFCDGAHGAAGFSDS